jgi:hypothetical protein
MVVLLRRVPGVGVAAREVWVPGAVVMVMLTQAMRQPCAPVVRNAV